jgi:hypothetical protein
LAQASGSPWNYSGRDECRAWAVFARHAAQKEFPNPIEGTPLPHMTLTDIPLWAARKAAGAALGASSNARNACIGADAANALSATGANYQRLLQGVREAISGKTLGQLRGEQARNAATLAAHALREK